MLTSATLTVGTDNTSPAALSGVVSDTTGGFTGQLSLTKVGTGTLTLSTPSGQIVSGSGGYDTYSGGTTVEEGTLLLDLSNATGSASNLLNSAAPLNLAGGTLGFKEQSGASAATQTFIAGTTINVGGSAIAVNVNGNTNVGSALALGPLTRVTGGTIDFGTLPATGSIAVSTANTAGSILGGWATVGGGATWAVSGASITGLTGYRN